MCRPSTPPKIGLSLVALIEFTTNQSRNPFGKGTPSSADTLGRAPKDSKITAMPKAPASLHRLEILSDRVCFMINLLYCFVVQVGRRRPRALALPLIRLKRSRFVE